MKREKNTMTRKRIFTVAFLLGLVLAAGATQAATLFTPPLVPDGENQLDYALVNVYNRLRQASIQVLHRKPLTFRFLVESPLRPPNNPLEWVDGSSAGVLCFEGIVGVNGNMNLSQFPNRILFNALFTIEFTD
jgi:hypothetical protein